MILNSHLRIPYFSYDTIASEIFKNIFKIIEEFHEDKLDWIITKISDFVKDNYDLVNSNDEVFIKIQSIFEEKEFQNLLSNKCLKNIFELINNFKETKDPFVIVNKNIDFLRYERETKKVIEKKRSNTKDEDQIQENGLFDDINKIQNNIFNYLNIQLNQIKFNNLLKLLYLFNWKIISINEFTILAEDILIYLDINTIKALKNIFEYKYGSKSNKFKFCYDSIDEDFNFNVSYKLKEKNSLYLNMSKTDLISYENINNKYICFFNAEHNITSDEINIKKHHKNIFEENMLKCENERFEFDIYIFQFKTAIKWLNLIKSNKKDLDLKEKLVNKLKNFSILELFLGLNQSTDELYNYIIENENENFINEISTKIEEKIEIMISIKNTNEQEYWNNIAQKNFYKSLDIKSYSIKNLEKNLISNKYFFNDIETKSEKIDELLNKANPLNSILKEINFLNSFEELINFDNFNENNNFKNLLKNIDFSKNNINLNIPLIILNFNFEDKSLLSDIFEIFIIGVLESRINENEKNKLINFFITFFKNIFNLNLKEINYSNENNNILNDIKIIEESNNNQTYSYYNNIIDNLKNNQEEDDEIELFKKSININNYKLDINKDKDKDNETNINDDKLNYDENIINDILPKKLLDSDKILYLNANFYLFLRYLYYFYQKMSLAIKICSKYDNINNINIFNLFKNLIINSITSNINNNIYEEIIKIIFETNSGLFLNLDKFFNLIIKVIPNETIINLILEINNKELNNEENENYSEKLKLCKLYYKLNEFNNNKNLKQQIGNNAISSNFDKIYRVIINDNNFYISRIKNIYKNKNLKNLLDMFQNIITISNYSISNIIKTNLENYYIKNEIKYLLKNEIEINFKNLIINDEDILIKKQIKKSKKNKKLFQIKKIIKMRKFQNKFVS